MKKILVLGNGFDLAHGLKTSYNDFLTVLKEWEKIYIQYKQQNENDVCLNYIDLNGNNIVFKGKLNSYNIEKMKKIIDDNSWVEYYIKCEAELDGWIDFEKEMYPVMQLFNDLSNCYGNGIFEVNAFNKYSRYINGERYLKDDFKIGNNRAKKNLLLDSIRKEFDEFIELLELYFIEFVYHNSKVNTLKQIVDIGATHVINFNYLPTEENYGITEVHHIHGKIRIDTSERFNNMIFGIDEKVYNNENFIYYMKFFQRIQKNTGVDYKKYIDESSSMLGVEVKEEYILYMYGHSLDKTDEDILKYLIGDVNEDGILKLKPKKVVFYYYNQKDFERKIINLIVLYGRSNVEKYRENGLFDFVPTEDM